MEEIKSPEEFLNEMGIEMQKTALICVIDDVLKQPSLPYLMNEYAKYVSNININRFKEIEGIN